MEAIFRKSEFDCYNKTLLLHQRKEESRDVVVPDTQPDISEVFFCGTRVLIRSKDVSPGRVRIEAVLGADVLYKGEDGKLWSVEISLPFFFSIDDERIGADCAAQTKLSIVGVEAKALNPRKILLRGELNAEISVFEKGRITVCEDIEGAPLLRSRKVCSDLSLITAVTEKTFAVSDEISLPPMALRARTLICLGTDSCIDELKSVGSKIIVKGKLKSRLIIINEEGELCHMEPESDFSQIVETGTEQIGGVTELCLCPSGMYCDILRDNTERISLEYHMVAQLLCRLDSKLCYIDEVYSNSFVLEKQCAELEIEKVWEHGREREKQRVLIETPVGVNEVLCSYVWPTGEIVDKGKIVLSYNLAALCLGDGGLYCEKKKGEISFRIPEEGECYLNNSEICDWAVLPVPGGLELRLEAAGEIICKSVKKLNYVSKLSYDEEKLIDNSDKPSLVLLRPDKDDDLWSLARENCSSEEAIMSANGLEDISEALGKLILIPKTN